MFHREQGIVMPKSRVKAPFLGGLGPHQVVSRSVWRDGKGGSIWRHLVSRTLNPEEKLSFGEHAQLKRLLLKIILLSSTAAW